MLTGGTEVKNSAGYVAIERVSGTLHGKTGTFPSATQRDHGAGRAVADRHGHSRSGTGELAGLTGSMRIIIADGKHSYDFDYTLAPRP